MEYLFLNKITLAFLKNQEYLKHRGQMAGMISKIKGKSILSRVHVDQLVAGIASLGDRTDQLKNESWRLNRETELPTSLWGEVIDYLQLDHDERTRHALYDLWNSNRHDIVTLVKRMKRLNEGKETNDDVSIVDEKENNSVLEQKESNLCANESLPLPSRPNTRANQRNNIGESTLEYAFEGETSFVCSAVEWKSAFSYTDQKMKEDYNWRILFSNKLTASGIRCPLKFRQPYIRQGKRKHRCKFFCCYAQCLYKSCERTYQITSMKQASDVSSVVFLVRIYGKEYHDVENEAHGREMQSQDRDEIGKKFT